MKKSKTTKRKTNKALETNWNRKVRKNRERILATPELVRMARGYYGVTI